MKISAKFYENFRKTNIFAGILTKIRRSLTKFCEHFEIGAVRRYVNSLELEKCFLKMNIWLQKIGFDTEENEPSKV